MLMTQVHSCNDSFKNCSMLDFLSSHSSAMDSLQRRRFNAHVRHILCAVCSALTLFAVCQSIAEGSRNRIQIVVASREIARGQQLSSEDLSLISIPESSVTRHFVHTIEAADGKQSQTTLSAGQPLPSNAISEGLSIAAGRTSIQIQLASVPSQLSVGDTVRLVSSASCSQAESSVATEDGSATQPSEDPDLHSANAESDLVLTSVCTLAKQAQVLSIAEPSDDSLLNSITANSEDQSLVTFCVSPEEAVAILSQQQHGPILAVSG